MSETTYITAITVFIIILALYALVAWMFPTLNITTMVAGGALLIALFAFFRETSHDT
jgi:hypothetical protein